MEGTIGITKANSEARESINHSQEILLELIDAYLRFGDYRSWPVRDYIQVRERLETACGVTRKWLDTGDIRPNYRNELEEMLQTAQTLLT